MTKFRWQHHGFNLQLQFSNDGDSWNAVPMVDENGSPTDEHPAEKRKRIQVAAKGLKAAADACRNKQ